MNHLYIYYSRLRVIVSRTIVTICWIVNWSAVTGIFTMKVRALGNKFNSEMHCAKISDRNCGPGTIVSPSKIKQSTEEVLNHDPLQYTRPDIFGANDTSDEDVDHTAETGGRKRKIRRVRLSEKKRIEIALHSQNNPLLSQKRSHWLEQTKSSR